MGQAPSQAPSQQATPGSGPSAAEPTGCKPVGQATPPAGTGDATVCSSSASGAPSPVSLSGRRPGALLYGFFGVGGCALAAGTWYGVRVSRNAAAASSTMGSAPVPPGWAEPAAEAAVASAVEGGAGGSAAVTAEQELVNKLHPAMRRIPGTGQSIGGLAARAFIYGSILSVVGTGALVVSVCWMLDTWTVEDFAARMRRTVPGVRRSIQGTVVPIFTKLHDDSTPAPRPAAVPRSTASDATGSLSPQAAAPTEPGAGGGGVSSESGDAGRGEEQRRTHRRGRNHIVFGRRKPPQAPPAADAA